jgi:hypothetical protein
MPITCDIEFRRAHDRLLYLSQTNWNWANDTCTLAVPQKPRPVDPALLSTESLGEIPESGTELFLRTKQLEKLD